MDTRRGLPFVLVFLVLGTLGWWLFGPGTAPPDESAPVPEPASAPVDAPAPVPPPAHAPGLPSPPTPPPVAAAPAPLPESGFIDGVVRCAEGAKEEAPDVLVILKQGRNGRGAPEVRRTTSGPDGTFRFDGVPAGEWCFSTRTPGSTAWDHVHPAAVLQAGGRASVTLLVERPVPEGTGLLVRGTVRFQDGSPAPAFSFTLRNEEGPYLVEGTGGKFERRLPGADSYGIDGVFVDGRPHPGVDSTVEVLEDGTALVVLSRPSAAALQVMDATTRAPLPGARGYRERLGDYRSGDDHHPNAESLAGEPLAAGGDGVIDLGTGTGKVAVYVVAEGHAWRKIEIAFGSPGPAPVPLHPGGRLRLEVRRWGELEAPTITVGEEDFKSRRTLPPLGETGRGVYEGIPAGPQTVTVRTGPWYGRGLVYGTGKVEIPAGGEATLALDVDPGGAGAPGPVTLRVTAPSGWETGNPPIEIEGSDPANSSVDLSGTVLLPPGGEAGAWTTKPVPPGRYQVRVWPHSYHDIVVPAGGGTFDIVLPATVEVRVKVVDRQTGEPVPGAKVVWHFVHPGRTGYSLDEAGKGEEPGESRFRAPAGKVAIWASGKGYENDTDIEFDVAPPGPVIHVAKIGRAGALLVKLKWEGSPPPWNEVGIGFSLGSSTYGMNVENGRALRNELPPGTGSVVIDLPEDQYEKVPPMEAEIRAGETTEVEVLLVRKER